MPSHLGKIASLVLLLAAVSAAAAGAAPSGGLSKNTIEVGGHERSYLLYVPRNLAAHPPLLIVFHGSDGDGASVRRATGDEFDRLADAHGFLVAYPDGYRGNWNDCRKKASYPARTENIDDEGFVSALAAREVMAHGADPAHVFAVGHSNGAQMALRLALERPKEIAGAAIISASLPTPDNMACTPSDSPIPVLIMNGTDDPLNPYAGGEVTLFGFASRGTVLSTQTTADYFAKRNGDTGAPEISRLEHRDPKDPTWVEKSLWSAPGKRSVVLYTVHGGGHVVPQPVFSYPRLLGRQTEDVDAPAVIWDFFSAVPR
jgi:polyhydroxybutyrate depolymerase